MKAAATVTARDFRGLRKLRETAKERFAAGVVIYDGNHVAGFGDNLYAVPIRALWEITYCPSTSGRFGFSAAGFAFARFDDDGALQGRSWRA